MVESQEDPQSEVSKDEVHSQYTPPLRRSDRVCQAPMRYDFIIENDNLINIIQDDDPLTYLEVVMSRDSDRWLEAIKSEMNSMYTNQVWTLVDAPKGVTPIGCKWVFKKKIEADGQVETYKARLVTKDFSQRQGIDYDETFSPVAMLKSVRILLVIAAYYDYEIRQMDVKTAFLNDNLEKEVYMTQPEGFISSGRANQVCKLKRSIYGLKQASRSWNSDLIWQSKSLALSKIKMNYVCIRRQVGVLLSSWFCMSMIYCSLKMISQ